jgi:hypothetical protein
VQFLFRHGLSEYSLLIGVKPISGVQPSAAASRQAPVAIAGPSQSREVNSTPSGECGAPSESPLHSSDRPAEQTATKGAGSPLPPALRKKKPYTPADRAISAPRMLFFVETQTDKKRKKKKKPKRKKRMAMEPSAGSQSGGYSHALSSSTCLLEGLDCETLPSSPRAYPCSSLHCGVGGGVVGSPVGSRPPSLKKLKAISLKLDSMSASEDDVLTVAQKIKQLNSVRAYQLEKLWDTAEHATERKGNGMGKQKAEKPGEQRTDGMVSAGEACKVYSFVHAEEQQRQEEDTALPLVDATSEVYCFVLVDFLQGPLQVKTKKKLFRSSKKKVCFVAVAVCSPCVSGCVLCSLACFLFLPWFTCFSYGWCVWVCVLVCLPSLKQPSPAMDQGEYARQLFLRVYAAIAE